MAPATPVQTPDFERLWEEKYLAKWADVARRNAYLIEGDGTADDLLQDLWINVWDKKVKGKWTEYAGKSTKPDVDAWAAMLLKHYLTDIARKRKTQPKEFGRSQRSLSAPVSADGAEGDPDATVEDFVGQLDRAFDMVDSESELENLLGKVKDPALKQTLQIMFAHDEPPEELWARIRRETGHSRGYLQEKLKKDPAILEFFKEHLGKQSGIPKQLESQSSLTPETTLFD